MKIVKPNQHPQLMELKDLELKKNGWNYQINNKSTSFKFLDCQEFILMKYNILVQDLSQVKLRLINKKNHYFLSYTRRRYCKHIIIKFFDSKFKKDEVI